MSNEEFEKVALDSTINMSLYDMNQQIISQLPFLTKEQLSQKAQEIDNKVVENQEVNKCYMLLCKDCSYYTLFVDTKIISHKDTFDYSLSIGEGVIDCLNYLSNNKIYAIDFLEELGNFEIWINYNDTATVVYLFPYDNGLITYGG